MTPKIHNLTHLINYRKSLRTEGTPAEAFLWTCLRNRQLEGRKFRRQHSIENMIVDFYCPEEKLIIELDGDAHQTASGQEDDRIRDERLNELGFTVLRYENEDVFQYTESILHDIVQHFRSCGNHP